MKSARAVALRLIRPCAFRGATVDFFGIASGRGFLWTGRARFALRGRWSTWRLLSLDVYRRDNKGDSQCEQNEFPRGTPGRSQ